MFSAAVTRVASRTPSVATAASTAITTPTSIASSAAAHRTAQCLATRQPHQRRHSSSKTSCPPASASSGGKPAPAAKSVAAPGSETAVTKAPAPDATTAPRGSKRLTKAKRLRGTAAVKSEDPFARLPSVSNTSICGEDLRLSNFYSLGRPLSLTTPIPPVSTAAAFESIFESPQPRPDAWRDGNSAEGRPEDVIYTLHNTIEALESEAHGGFDDTLQLDLVADEAAQVDSGAKAADSPQNIPTLHDVVSKFKPFQAPPPPQPFPEALQQRKESAWNALMHEAAKPKPRASKKSYATTIVVTESLDADGQRSFSALSSPLVRIPDPVDSSAAAEPAPRRRWQFRERMQQRARATDSRRISERTDARRFVRQAPSAKRSSMLAISVRRQRKLKMKKHKYKKLMKRTRNLRRRQDRA